MSSVQLCFTSCCSITVGASIKTLHRIYDEMNVRSHLRRGLFQFLTRRTDERAGPWSINAEGNFELIERHLHLPERITQALHHSMNIPHGKTVAFVSPKTGAGKSAVKSVTRFYQADRGRILLDGKDPPNTKPIYCGGRSAGAAKESQLQSTIEENIRYGISPPRWTKFLMQLGAHPA